MTQVLFAWKWKDTCLLCKAGLVGIDWVSMLELLQSGVALLHLITASLLSVFLTVVADLGVE